MVKATYKPTMLIVLIALIEIFMLSKFFRASLIGPIESVKIAA
jgi:hypothetical protein